VLGLVVLAAFVMAVPLFAEEAAQAPQKAAAPEKHLLAIKDGTACYCSCAKDCKCTISEDMAKCSCGKEVTKEALKGKFVCEKDKVIADKAGKCPTCDGDLKAVE
jgi:hypothetical protein